MNFKTPMMNSLNSLKLRLKKKTFAAGKTGMIVA